MQLQRDWYVLLYCGAMGKRECTFRKKKAPKCCFVYFILATTLSVDQFNFSLHSAGAVSQQCDVQDGLCSCKTGVEGNNCDSCQDQYYGFSQTGCRYHTGVDVCVCSQSFIF